MGCADLGSAPLPTDEPSAALEINSNTPADFSTNPHAVPATCGSTTLATPDHLDSMSVAASSSSARMVGLQNGSVVARSLDHGGMSGDLTKVRPKDDLSTIATVASAFAGDNLIVVTTTTDGTTFVDGVSADLTKVAELAKLPGNAIAHTPIVAASGAWLVPSVTDAGLHLTAFDRNFDQVEDSLFASSKPATYVAAANFGDNGAVVAWSTDYTCHLAYAESAFTTHDSQLPHACSEVQVATDLQGGNSVIVYQTAAGVMIAHAPHNALQAAKVLSAGASSPHVVFDGSKYWVSYLDLRGQVIVGFLDNATGHATTAALPVMRPSGDGFDLAMIGNAPFVVASDGDGFTTHRLCTK